VASMGCLKGTVWFEVLVTKQRVEDVSVEISIVLTLLLGIRLLIESRHGLLGHFMMAVRNL